jgi:dihydrolipoamide dehydrogenase
MVIIGGGVIGCEMACIYAAVGCKVTIIEALSQLLPTKTNGSARCFCASLKRSALKPKLPVKFPAYKSLRRATVQLEGGQSIAAEKVLFAVGRRACCDKETIDSLGLELRGPAIAVNKKMQTNVPALCTVTRSARRNCPRRLSGGRSRRRQTHSVTAKRWAIIILSPCGLFLS